MSHDTTCNACKYWSEMIAQNDKAFCLNRHSEHSAKYVPGWATCSQFSAGLPVDLDRVPPSQRQHSVMSRLDGLGFFDGDFFDD